MKLRNLWLLALCFLSFGQAGCRGERPADLGVTDGKLTPCPPSPNCVSSQAEDDLHRMEPQPYRGPATAVQAELLSVLERMERVEVVRNKPGYVYAEARSKTFGFTDDLEFYFDEAASLLHFRSASRLGHSDGGVNRARMEHILSQLENPR